MFKNRVNSGPFLITDYDSQKNNSFEAQRGDIAGVVVSDLQLQVQIELLEGVDGKWHGQVISHQPRLKGKSPVDRLEEIQLHEKFISENGLEIDSRITIFEQQIFYLSR